ncbi:MAG: HAD family hydrolase [Oscillospiraceae bacterium]
MNLTTIHTVIFDLDNTLADRKYSYSKHAETCGRLFLRDISLLDSFCSRLIELDNNGYGSKDLAYKTVYEEFPLKGSPAEMSAKWNENAGRFTRCEPFAEEILIYLRQKYTLALLTNGYSVTQNIKLDRTGLRKYFSAVVVSEDTGTMKPDPEIFRLTCRKTGASENECVYVGDHFENDIKGALSAGMSAVLYDRYRTSAENYPHTIYSLRELEDLL